MTPDNKFIEVIFERLSKNISFPYYQAERRIDIFINIFLNEIIQQHTPFKNAEFILPEFPLKHDDTGHSVRVDYLMFDPIKQIVLFIELKTDDHSYGEDQILKYEADICFKNWFDKMSKIKMKGFADKKATLTETIKEKIFKYNDNPQIQVVILKPTIDESGLLDKRQQGNRHYISLKNITIDTPYKEEWSLFKQMILDKLITKK